MRNSSRLISSIAFSVLAVLPSIALAQNPPKEGDMLTAREILSTARGYGLANAMVASSAGTSAIWHNPANITSAVMYSVDASYLYENDTEGHGAMANLVDMKSNSYVGAALGVFYQYADPQEKSQHTVDVRLGLAVPLANNLISIGVTGLYSYIQYDGNKILSQFSMDAGVTVRPLDWLAISFVAQNLIVGEYADYMPRMIGFGIMAGSLDLGLNVMFDGSFNISSDDIASTGSYGAGVEYVLKKLIPIRIGYRYESDDHHVIAAGLGYRHTDGLFGLDIAYQHHFDVIDNDIFSASVNFYF